MTLHEKVQTLNDLISDFNHFAADHGFNDEFQSLHFIGSLNSHEMEQALIDHQDEFLQFSQDVLNTDGMPREETLGHIDSINLQYKKVLQSAQEQRA